jgi:Rhodanese-like domain
MPCSPSRPGAACALAVLALAAGAALWPGATAADTDNRLIDYKAFTSQVAAVGELRQTHRVGEAEFLRMAADTATVVLDARSREKYDLLHVKGARHLSLPDMTEQDLARVIPDKQTRILIYCNNNFLNAPEAFPAKAPSASLNLHTFNALYSYGYRNVFELKPLLDIRSTKIPFEGTQAAPK